MKLASVRLDVETIQVIAEKHRKSLPTDPTRKDDAFFALYRTCRQLYHEVSPLWYKYNVVYIKDNSLCFPKTFGWIENLSNNTRQLLKYVEIRVLAKPLETLNNGILNVVDWLLFEHRMLKQGVQLHVIMPNDEMVHLWCVCLKNARELKDDGMSPAGVRERLGSINNKMLNFSAVLGERNNLAQHVRVELPWNRKLANNWWRFWSYRSRHRAQTVPKMVATSVRNAV